MPMCALAKRGSDVRLRATDILRRLVDKEAFMITEFDKGKSIVKITFFNDNDWVDFIGALGDARKFYDASKAKISPCVQE